MAEKITIFELDLDLDAAIKETARLSDNTDILKSRLDALKKSGSASTEEIVRAKAAYDDQNKQLKASQREIAKMVNLKGSEIKTVEQGRIALTLVNKEWARQTQLYGANSKEADNLAKKHLELKNRVNELQKGIGDTSGNIGNYANDIVDAAGKTTLFGRTLSIVNQVIGVAKPLYTALKTEILGIGAAYKSATTFTAGYTTAQKAATVVTSGMSAALKVFKLALIATGIGAIVVALGTLIAFFSKTQRGTDFVSKALAGLGAAFDVVIDRVIQFGEGLFQILSGKFTQGLDTIKRSFQGIGDEIQREVGLARELEQALQDLRDKEIGLITVQASRKRQIEELRFAAKDEQKDLRERARLLEEAGKLEEQILADQLATDKERARISQLETDRSESSAEELEENARLQAQVIETETASLKLRRSIEAEKQGLLKRARSEEAAAAKERLAEATKMSDAAIKESKTRLDIFIAENEGKNLSLVESLAFEEQIRDKRLAIAQAELESGKKTQTETELEKLKIKQEFLEKQKDLTVEFANEELQLYLDNHRARIEAGQLLTDALVQQEVDRLTAIQEKEAEYQKIRLEQGEINQREYNSLINDIDEEYRSARAELETELAEQKKEVEILDLENRRAAKEEELEYDRNLQLEFLERKRQIELEAAERIGADTSSIEEKYADAKKVINETVADNKASLLADGFANFATVLGKESKLGKAAAIAETTITTYQSATNAFNSLSGIPIVGPVLGAIAAAAAVVSGIANVRKIASTSLPKAEKGALFEIGGSRHHSGGTKFYGEDGTSFEAERGELIGVMNRRASQAFMGFNNQYVTTSTGGPSNFLADGGIVSRGFVTSSTAPRQTGGLDLDLLVAKMTEANRALPAPVTDVKDIVTQVNSLNKIVNGANL